MEHTPLHHLAAPAEVRTGGRLRLTTEDYRWALCNALAAVPLVLPPPPTGELPYGAGELVQVEGRWDGACLEARAVERVFVPPSPSRAHQPPQEALSAEAVRGWSRLVRRARGFFAQRGFLEVCTPCWVGAPGTDPYLEPVAADYHPGGTGEPLRGWLHTSPELSMKRMLCAGHERIVQLVPVWRDGELGPLHQPEFRILEWYRAWQGVEAVIEDVEALVYRLCDGVAQLPGGATVELVRPFARLTMAEVVQQACDFRLMEALEAEALRRRMKALDLLPPGGADGWAWDELFALLQVARLDPWLAGQGAVFVTDWPAALAVLARRREDDPRVAERFELYVGGVELANGFGELRDAAEQRARFLEDQRVRCQRGGPELPLPSAFLEALAEVGMPPAAGVALGVDRVLMLALGAERIRDVVPFGLERGEEGWVGWR